MAVSGFPPAVKMNQADFREAFQVLYGCEPRVFSAPGRVNLIGEHTDYNEGFVLPFAINRRTFVAASPRTDGKIRVRTQTLDESAEFSLDESAEGENSWARYVKGVAGVLRSRGFALGGADLLIDSEVPFGAGLSSSAALEVSLGLAMTLTSGLSVPLRDLAFIGQQVEHKYIGVNSGIMDQFASALAKKSHALLIDCRSFQTTDVPLVLRDAVLVVCDTNVKHELASSEYNTRRAECEEGVRIIGKLFPDVKSLRDVSLEMFDESANSLPERVRKRCRHVVSENARTLSAVEALEKGDLTTLGRLMTLSHLSLRDDYQVSCPELDELVDIALDSEGVLGSRMTGGGFGGCTVTLLKRDVLKEFSSRIITGYTEKFGFAPDVFYFETGDGAGENIQALA
jgi:galactokinase